MSTRFRYPAKEYLQEMNLRNQSVQNEEPESTLKAPDSKAAFTRLVDFVKAQQKRKSQQNQNADKATKAYKQIDTAPDLKKGLQVKKSV